MLWGRPGSVRKISPSPGLEARTVRPMVSRCIDDDLGCSLCMNTKGNRFYIEVVTFRLVVHQRKSCRDSVIWNTSILQYLDGVCHCFLFSVPRRESASHSVQVSCYTKWYQSSGKHRQLRQIETVRDMV
jgi:hypothetical protein